MGCIHRHEIIKSDISHQYSQDEIFKQSFKEDNIPKLNSINNNKSNNLFYVNNNSNNSGSNVTSNNKLNSGQVKDNTISSLISNDYFNNKYKLIGEISNQQNIEEFKIQLKSNPSIYRCMRKIKKNSTQKQNMEIEDKSVYEEVNLLKGINHKHICKLYECITTPNDYFLIMDYCKEGNLENKLKWSIKYSENQIKYLAFQLFSAVQYLNQNNYMHTDIKPINILIDEIIKNEKDEDLFNVKLLNFGSYGENIETNNNMNMLPYYVAPEIIDNKFDVTSDVWSIGVIIYQMFYGEVPFGGESINEIYSNIKNGKVTQTSSASSNLKDLLDLIFVKDYKERINVNKCLEHNWFCVGSKTPRDTEIFKNCIIEEINTDTKVINEEKNSKITESNKNEEEEKTSNKNISNKENNKKRVSDKNKESKKIFKLSIPNGKRISRPILLEYGKNQKNSKIPPLIRYMILYIKYYIRIYFQQDKEINKLNNIYLKYKLENNIHLFINYVNNTKKISFDYFYYNQNNLLNKNLSNNIKEQINNKEELFKILIQNKKNFIENNLKKSFGKLKKSSVQEIKNIFKESNNINLYEIQKYKIYFNEIEFEMEKNKYKEIYLYTDFYKMLINSINKLYSQFLSNNISTNVDSNYTNNTMFGKSKESIKNENSKENNDHNKEEGEKIIPIDEIIKDPEKNKKKSINSLNSNKNEIKYVNIKNGNLDFDINNKNIKVNIIENINGKKNNDVNNFKEIKKEIKNVNINKSKRKSYMKELKRNSIVDSMNSSNKKNSFIKPKNTNNIINNTNNNIIQDEDEDDYETEERKKDKNRFDPEKFLSIIGFS